MSIVSYIYMSPLHIYQMFSCVESIQSSCQALLLFQFEMRRARFRIQREQLLTDDNLPERRTVEKASWKLST